MHGDALGSTRHGQAPSSSDRANSDRRVALFSLGERALYDGPLRGLLFLWGDAHTALCAQWRLGVWTGLYLCMMIALMRVPFERGLDGPAGEGDGFGGTYERV